MSAPAPIPFIDLKAQRARLGAKIDEAVLRVVNHGQYILGPEIGELEKALAEYAGVADCVSCGSGTDALQLYLMAKNIGPGQAVFVPAFTFIATVEMVALLGATPVFVDVEEDSFNISAASLEAAIGDAERHGLAPVGVIPVDLFGQPADYPAIEALASKRGLWVLADACQSFGGTLGNVRVGAMGEAAATSFFPAKPLGCYGDGGAIFTSDADLAETLRSIRVHGQGVDKYTNVRLGMNARMDTMQAAILLEKLAIFDDELDARQKVADRYNAALKDVAAVPVVKANATSAWAQYTLKLSGGEEQRAALQAACQAAGVPTAVYYPIPLNRQEAYAQYPSAPGGVPVSEKLSACVVSLPMHPYLDEATQGRVIEAVRGALA